VPCSFLSDFVLSVILTGDVLTCKFGSLYSPVVMGVLVQKVRWLPYVLARLAAVETLPRAGVTQPVAPQSAVWSPHAVGPWLTVKCLDT
jgi:hypothetical protein